RRLWRRNAFDAADGARGNLRDDGGEERARDAGGFGGRGIGFDGRRFGKNARRRSVLSCLFLPAVRVPKYPDNRSSSVIGRLERISRRSRVAPGGCPGGGGKRGICDRIRFSDRRLY